MTDTIDPQDLEILARRERPPDRGPIPSDGDRQIGQVVEKLRRVDPAQLNSIRYQHYDDALIGFAERMATLAVRRQSRKDLNNGVAAACLAASITDDVREVLLILAPLWHSAGLLGLDARHEFLAVAEELDGDGGKVLEAFTHRTPETQSLEAMRYVASEDEDGFVYRRVSRTLKSHSAQATPGATGSDQPAKRPRDILARLRTIVRSDRD